MKHRFFPRAFGFALIAVALTVAGSARSQTGQRFVERDLFPGGLKSVNDVVDCSTSSPTYCDTAYNFMNFTTEGSFGPTGWGAVVVQPNGINGTHFHLTGKDVSWCYVAVTCSDGSESDDQETGTLLNGVGAAQGGTATNPATDCFASCPRGVQTTGVYSQVAIVRAR